jgi:hypothetical protein
MEIFGWQYAFNLFSHNAPMTENGYNEEEMKMVMVGRPYKLNPIDKSEKQSADAILESGDTSLTSQAYTS